MGEHSMDIQFDPITNIQVQNGHCIMFLGYNPDKVAVFGAAALNCVVTTTPEAKDGTRHDWTVQIVAPVEMPVDPSIDYQVFTMTVESSHIDVQHGKSFAIVTPPDQKVVAVS
jgi:hypothetical protein